MTYVLVNRLQLGDIARHPLLAGGELLDRSPHLDESDSFPLARAAGGVHCPGLVSEAALASERVERRPTAILAADIAGYSRLMGADEEGTLAQLKAHRRELGRQLLQRLQAHYPGAHADGQLRTLQRRLKAWRAEMARGLILGIPANSAGDRSASSAPAYPDTEQARGFKLVSRHKSRRTRQRGTYLKPD